MVEGVRQVPVLVGTFFSSEGSCLKAHCITFLACCRDVGHHGLLLSTLWLPDAARLEGYPACPQDVSFGHYPVGALDTRLCKEISSSCWDMDPRDTLDRTSS